MGPQGIPGTTGAPGPQGPPGPPGQDAEPPSEEELLALISSTPLVLNGGLEVNGVDLLAISIKNSNAIAEIQDQLGGQAVEWIDVAGIPSDIADGDDVGLPMTGGTISGKLEVEQDVQVGANLSVSGTAQFAHLQLGSETLGICQEDAAGSLAYQSGDMLLCDGADWRSVAVEKSGQMVQRDFVSFSDLNTGDTDPIHIKTNLTSSQLPVYRIAVEGFNYFTGRVINSDVAGFLHNSQIQKATTNDYATGATISQYVSSDGYLVVKVHPGPFNRIVGFSASAWILNGGIDVSATIVRQAVNL
jgi:hypothetical protein